MKKSCQTPVVGCFELDFKVAHYPDALVVDNDLKTTLSLRLWKSCCCPP